ncbi:MAG: DUF202 domain-containing protein [Alicyclobacillus sp.]|nr:DUF202 domain-containing protein [Alicyclobacillus sp.]
MNSEREPTQDQQRSTVPPRDSVDEWKYVQQHLANERTFLAWVRTTISILGVGFVTTTLHFELRKELHPYGDVLIELIGLFTLVLSLVMSAFATISYLNKRRGINNFGFHSTGIFVVFVSSSIAAILIAMACYMAFAY